MKTMLYALAAVALTASAAVAEPATRTSPVSEAASVKAPAAGDRANYDRMPVSLNRDLGFENQPLDGGRPVGRGWTGNDNEG